MTENNKRFRIGDEEYTEFSGESKKKWVARWYDNGEKASEITFDTLNNARFAHGTVFRWNGEVWLSDDGIYLVKEDVVEEVNTSYDQDQEIGDDPQALNTELSGSEPIDAPTGEDFYTIQTGGPKEGLGEYSGVWKQLGYEGIDEDFDIHEEYECTICGKIENDGMYMQDHIQLGHDEFDFDKHMKVNEKLNKDGTGTKSARRGLDPNNKKNQVMKFDYVSKSDCEICKQYDGKTFGWDSPNRPVIPRLEKGDGERPYTHPNCKCRWTKVFNEANININMKSNEMAHDEKLLARARAEAKDKEAFDKLSYVEKNLIIIGMLKKDLGMESEADEFIEAVDPMPVASMAVMAFNAIKPAVKVRLGKESHYDYEYDDGYGHEKYTCNHCGMEFGKGDDDIMNIHLKRWHNIKESKTNATESDSPYGIQPMLDQIVDKALGKEEKKDIEEEVSKDFTLDNLLHLVADKLAKKAGKKMGLESYKIKSNEVDPNHFADAKSWYQASKNKEKLAGGGLSDDYDELPDWNRENIQYAFHAIRNGEQVDRSDWYEDDYYKGESADLKKEYEELSAHAAKYNLGLDHPIYDKIYNLGLKISNATEGGTGSGKAGHQKWMLGTYQSKECPTCMISTEWEDGCCMMCGN